MIICENVESRSETTPPTTQEKAALTGYIRSEYRGTPIRCFRSYMTWPGWNRETWEELLFLVCGSFVFLVLRCCHVLVVD